jgi:hypothetical protein
MPSTSAGSRFRAWATAQQQVVTLAAILVALPAAYAFHTTLGGSAGGLFLLLLLGVGVPTAYDDHWPAYDRTWQAVAWTLVACGVVAAAFTGLYVAGREWLALGTFPAAVGAFLATTLLNQAWLAARRRL